MPSWIPAILKWMVRLGPMVYELSKLTVKIIREWKKLKNPAGDIIKEYRQEQQKKKTISYPPK